MHSQLLVVRDGAVMYKLSNVQDADLIRDLWSDVDSTLFTGLVQKEVW